ncbi:MAG: hypothetical protein RL588_2666 [Pseudomonadota bacterium]|jgi:uncharacterized protein (TIGR02466 family)
MSATTLRKAVTLLESGDAAGAVRLTDALVKAARPDHLALATRSQALKLLHRPAEALEVNRRAAALYPDSAVAWHNLAATLDDMGRHDDAREAIERGMALGLDGPESWAVRARVLMACGDHAGAEAAYVEARKRALGDPRLTAEYANYVWMLRGDARLGLSAMDTCFNAGGDPGACLLTKVDLLRAAGHPAEAESLLAQAADALTGDLDVQLAATHAAILSGDLARAEARLAAATALSPAGGSVLNQTAILHLSAGRPDTALAAARRGLEASPHDQSLLGWAATAARACGDPLASVLNDYAGLVRPQTLEAPRGWPDLASFLADLASALKGLHVYERQPINQSVRGGLQTLQNLSGSQDPVIAALFEALDAPIRRYMADLGPGQDPHRSRVTGDYRIQGAWSVRLKPGGFHADHFHPQGWISSAFYVETPDQALDRETREGWIRFGQPPTPTTPPLEAEHYVRPEPGRLVLFPSYMWHGTVPFTTDESRMTVAFDLVPA